jgi:hypothetical protein
VRPLRSDEARFIRIGGRSVTVVFDRKVRKEVQRQLHAVRNVARTMAPGVACFS